MENLKQDFRQAFAKSKDSKPKVSDEFIEWDGKGNRDDVMVFDANFANPRKRGGHGLESHSHAQEEGELLNSPTAAMLAQKTKDNPNFDLSVSETSTGESESLDWEITDSHPLVVIGQASTIATTKKMPATSDHSKWEAVDLNKPGDYFEERPEPKFFNEIAMAVQRIGNGSWGHDNEKSANIIFDTAAKGFIVAKKAAQERGKKCVVRTGLLGAGAFKNSPEVSIAMQYMAARLSGVDVEFVGIQKGAKQQRVNEIMQQVDAAIAAGKTPDQIIAAMPALVLSQEGRSKQNANSGWAVDKDGNPKLGNLVQVINQQEQEKAKQQSKSNMQVKASALPNQAQATQKTKQLSPLAKELLKAASSAQEEFEKLLPKTATNLIKIQVQEAEKKPSQATIKAQTAKPQNKVLDKVLGTKVKFSREFLLEHKNDIVLFGDNNIDKNRKSGYHQAFGGQAGMFGEPGRSNELDRANGVGITTTFFTNDGKNTLEPSKKIFKELMDRQFEALIKYAEKGGTVIFPEDEKGNHKFGTGLAVDHLKEAYLEDYKQSNPGKPITTEVREMAEKTARIIAGERQQIIHAKLEELKAASKKFSGPELTNQEKESLQKELLQDLANDRNRGDNPQLNPARLIDDENFKPNIIKKGQSPVSSSARQSSPPQQDKSKELAADLAADIVRNSTFFKQAFKNVALMDSVAAELKGSELVASQNKAPNEAAKPTSVKKANGEKSHVLDQVNKRIGQQSQSMGQPVIGH